MDLRVWEVRGTKVTNGDNSGDSQTKVKLVGNYKQISR